MASPSTDSSITTYDLMDGMRALAAVAVLLSHERNILFMDATAVLSVPWKLFFFLTGFGHEAVMIFFVLSGYWITKTVLRRSAGETFDWYSYGIDRISRLWIVLVPALLIGGALDSIGRYGTSAPIYRGTQGTSTLTWDVATHLTIANFGGNLAFLQTLFVEPFGTNGPLWSLANEFWYYVWFPTIFLLSRRVHSPIALIILTAITMAAFRSLLPGFSCWLCGALLFFFTRSPSPRIMSRHATTVTIVAGAITFLSALYLSRLHPRIDGRVIDLAVSGSFALLLFTLIRAERTYTTLLRPLCRFGASSSYSLYVVHFPFIVLVAALFITPAHRLPPSGALLAVYGGVALLTTTYGYAVSAVTEANTPKVRRWLKEKRLWVKNRVG